MPSFYAELLKGSFESLKSAADPGMRSSGGSMIELTTTEDPVLGKVVPVKENLRAALTDAGYKVKADGEPDLGEEDGPTPEVKPSLESSGHDPVALAAMTSAGQVPKETNLVVNGVHLADSVSENPVVTKVAIMTPNDVASPDADVIYMTDDEDGAAAEYLSMEGRQVVSSPEQLIALLRS